MGDTQKIGQHTNCPNKEDGLGPSFPKLRGFPQIGQINSAFRDFIRQLRIKILEKNIVILLVFLKNAS